MIYSVVSFIAKNQKFCVVTSILCLIFGYLYHLLIKKQDNQIQKNLTTFVVLDDPVD